MPVRVNEKHIPSQVSIIFEDESILVLDKPAQVHSVISEKSNNQSLAAWLIEHFPECAQASPKTTDGGLIQRLDFETSGLIVAAKTRAVWLNLYAQLKATQFKKKYLALVEGHAAPRFEIQAFIGSPNRGAKKVRVYPEKPKKRDRALAAHTEIKLIAYLENRNQSLVEAKAASARRHQIRAHCAFSGHPLVGDDLYGSTQELELELESHRSGKFFLLASEVCFTHPLRKEEMQFCLPAPSQLTEDK